MVPDVNRQSSLQHDFTGGKLGRFERKRIFGTGGKRSMWMGNALSTAFPENNREPDPRLIIKSGGRVIFIRIDEIDWIEADANYVRLHVNGRESYLFRKTISKMAAELDGSRFIRIHRSYIVNVSRIRELQSCNSGEFIVSLRDGKELPCSRTYRRALQSLYRPR